MTDISSGSRLSEPLYWLTPEELQALPLSGMEKKADHILKNCFGKDGRVDMKLLEESEKEVIRHFRDIKGYLDKALLFIGRPLTGRVVDLGAGTGTLTSIISHHAGLQKACAVEISEAYVNRIMPIVFSATDADTSRIDRIIGNFDRLGFEDSSIDFVIENGAFHHSDNIELTIRETSRILKKDGWFIGIDRGHPGNLTNKDLDEMLEKPFGQKIKAIYGIPEEKHITRRDWGEHELRCCDWNHYFSKQGFRTYILSFFRPTGLSKLLWPFYRIFGDMMLKRRVFQVPYLKWFGDRKYIRTLILAQKA
jgi:SAM-dependent methyltransferase